jgi:PST family polysaccharide transporter
MSIFRAGIYSAFATFARLLAGLLVVKLVALFAGPVGVGKMGQFMSIMSLMSAFAGGGIASGITKYVAEYTGSPSRLQRLISSGLTFAGCTSLFIGLLTLLFSRTIAFWLFSDFAYESLIWVLALAQAMIAMHNFFLAIINGFIDVRRVAVIHILGSALSLLVTALLAWKFRLYGALLGLVLGQAAMLLVSSLMFLRSPHFSRAYLRPNIDREMLLKLLRYSAMTLTSALLPQIVSILIRNYLAERLSWVQVGYWQAVSKVSEAYLLFFTMAISMYYLPKLSSINEREAFRLELKSAYRHILPVVIALAGIVYLFRDLVLQFLFRNDFMNAAPLFAPQLIGDVVKIAAFVLSYIMLAKAMTVTFIVSEFVFSATYVLLVYLFVDYFGLVGAMYAFALNYVAYLIFTSTVARWYMKRMT